MLHFSRINDCWVVQSMSTFLSLFLVLLFVFFFNLNCSSKCVVRPHYDLNFHFPYGWRWWISFLGLICPHVSSLVKYSFMQFVHFIIELSAFLKKNSWVLRVFFLHILWVHLQKSGLQIFFSQSVVCLSSNLSTFFLLWNILWCHV